MRIVCLLITLLAFPACATMTYTSSRPAMEVSECIAGGWRTVSASGHEIPVPLTKSEDCYFVDVVMVRDFPTFLPIHSMWAKVWDSPAGSVTEYRRNFQLWHGKIDRVVVECQGNKD